MIEQLGWLDTNLFVHILFAGDPHRERCQALLYALREGRAEGWIDPVVVHELTYVLSRQRQFANRGSISRYVLGILRVDHIHADDKAGLVEAVELWAQGRIGFADAWLTMRARRRRMPICTVNAGDFPLTLNSYPTAAV